MTPKLGVGFCNSLRFVRRYIIVLLWSYSFGGPSLRGAHPTLGPFRPIITKWPFLAEGLVTAIFWGGILVPHVPKWWGRYQPFLSTMFGSSVTCRWLLVISVEMCFFSTQKRNCYFGQNERSQKVPVMLFLFPIRELVGVGTIVFWLPCTVQELWLTQKRRNHGYGLFSTPCKTWTVHHRQKIMIPTPTNSCMGNKNNITGTFCNLLFWPK